MNLPTVASLLTITTLLTAIASTEPEPRGTPGTPPFATAADTDTARPDSSTDSVQSTGEALRDLSAGSNTSEIAATETPEAPSQEAGMPNGDSATISVRIPVIRESASKTVATRSRSNGQRPADRPPAGGSPAASANPSADR